MPVFESAPVIPVVNTLPGTAPDGAMVQLDVPQPGDGPKRVIHIRFQGQWFDIPSVTGLSWGQHFHDGLYAPAVHGHDAAHIVSGTFADARIPSLNASKINAGTFMPVRGGTGLSSPAVGNYLKTNGVNAYQTLTPAQVRSDIDAVDTGSFNTWVGIVNNALNGKSDTSHTHDGGGGVETRALNNIYETHAPSTFATGTVTVGRVSLASRGFPTAAGLVVTEVGDSTLRATQKYGASDGTTWFRSAMSSTAWGDWETISYGPWTSIPPFTGITNNNAEWRLAPGNRVEMRGRFSHASATNLVVLSTTLPAAARPSSDRYFAGGLAAGSTNQPGGLLGRVGVLSTGTINCILGQQTGVTGVFVDGSYSL